jgi:hypothetical protein
MTEHDFGQLDQLASDFWQWRAFHQPNSSDDIPRIERPRGWVPDWSQAAVERQRAALAAFTARWKSIDVSAWPIALLRWEYLGSNDEMIMLDA